MRNRNKSYRTRAVLSTNSNKNTLTFLLRRRNQLFAKVGSSRVLREVVISFHGELCINAVLTRTIRVQT